MSLGSWRHTLIAHAASVHATQVDKFALVPILECPQLALRGDILEELVACGVWAVQDHKQILDAIEQRGPFSVVAGFRATRLHIGHLTLARELAMWVRLGGKPIIVVANFEREATIDWSTAQCAASNLWRRVVSLLPDELATVQPVVLCDTHTPEILDLEANASRHIKFSKLRQLYGWGESTTLRQARVPAVLSSSFLSAQIVYPDTPSVVLIDINQGTHAEMTRIVASQLRMRRPCFTYRLLLQSLKGPGYRMSIKDPKSVAFLDESERELSNKLGLCVSGGRSTVDEQKQKGGRPDVCSFFHIAHSVLAPSESEAMLRSCTTGNVLCGQCKAGGIADVVAMIRGGAARP